MRWTNDRPIKLLCLIPELRTGGAELVLISLLKKFSRDRIKPILVLLQNKTEYVNQLPEDIKLIELGKKGRFDFFRISFALASIIKKECPDAILSFLWYSGIVAIVAKKLSGINTVTITAIRNFLSICIRREKCGLAKTFLAKRLLKYSSATLVLAKPMKEDMVEKFNLDREKIHIIPNPVDIPKIKARASEKIDHPWFGSDKNIPVIIAIGRLTEQKGYPHLLEAFKNILSQQPARLFIIGSGQDQAKLEKLVANYGIGENVCLAGVLRNPLPYLAKSDVFVLSSFYEGFPNAMVEAMALAVPVVATNCPSAVSDIITDGFSGLLIPVADPSAMQKAVIRILNNKDFAKKLGDNAVKAVENYPAEHVVELYQSVIEKVIKRNGNDCD